MKTKELADALPSWFKEYTREQQNEYLKNHPNSKISKTVKNETKEDNKSSPKKLKILNVKDYLLKNGSPTNFTGPDKPEDSSTGNYKLDKKVSALLDKLADLTEKAIAENKDAPDYNLCDIQVPGTNLFCNNNLGVARQDMPQLKGKPTEGSWADLNLEKDKSGEVNSETAFRKLLENKGVKITSKRLPANTLKATQKELVGSKVAGMTRALQENPHDIGITAPIFVSKDGYVLDGHHRWVAQVGLGIKSGIKNPIEMDAEVVDMTMEELLALTNNFCEAIGIKAKAGKAKEHSHLRILKVLSTTDKSPNTKKLSNEQELEDYFSTSDVLVVINNSGDELYKIGSEYKVEVVNDTGVLIISNNDELWLSNPEKYNSKFSEVDNNNFTYTSGKLKITFLKK